MHYFTYTEARTAKIQWQVLHTSAATVKWLRKTTSSNKGVLSAMKSRYSSHDLGNTPDSSFIPESYMSLIAWV